MSASAKTTFAENHLFFLRVDGKWWPGLVFDGYFSCQQTFEKIGGYGFLRGLVSDDWMKRTFVNVPKPTSGKVAILLGAKKRVLWSDSFPEARSFFTWIGTVYSEDLSTDHKDAIQEGKQFFFFKSVAVNEADAALALSAPQEVETSHQETVVAESEDTSMGEANAEDLLLTQENQDSPSEPETPPNADPPEQDDTSTVIASVGSWHNDHPTAPQQSNTPPTDPLRTLQPRAARDAIPESEASAEDAKENKRASHKSKNAREKASKKASRKAATKASKKAGPKNHLSLHKTQSSRSSPRNESQKRRVKFKEAIKTKAPQLSKSRPQVLTKAEKAKMWMVPDTKQVMKKLQELGYTTQNTHYFRPGFKALDKKELIEGLHYFSSILQLRLFLCRHGVEGSKGTELLEDDEEFIQKWVRYAICPSLRNKKKVPEDARQPYSSIYPPLTVLGFKCTAGTYHLPEVKPKAISGLPVNGFEMDGPNGLWAMLSRHGLPDNCDFHKLSESDRLRVELYLAECPFVETFTFEKDVDSAAFDEASSMASAKKSEAARSTAGSQALSEEKPDSLHSVQTPIVANKAASVTVQPTTDQGSVSAESIAPTIVTNCSTGTSTDNNIGKRDAFVQDTNGIGITDESASIDESEDNYMPLTQAESDGKLASSPLQHDDESIADAHAGPKPGSSPPGPAPTKNLFQNTPAEVAEKRKRMSIAGKDAESVPQLPSEGSAVIKEAQDANYEATSEVVASSIDPEAEKKEDVSRTLDSDALLASATDLILPPADISEAQLTPPKQAESTNQNPSPDPDTMKMDLSDNECNGSPDVKIFYEDLCDSMLTQEAFHPQDETVTREPSLDPQEEEALEKLDGANETQPAADSTGSEIGNEDADETEFMDAQQEHSADDVDSADERQAAAASASDEETTPDDVTKDEVDETKYEKWIENLRGVVEPNALWMEVELKMRAYGLQWGHGGGLSNYTYMFPGRRGKQGVLGWDYVDTTFDLQKLAVERLNWIGDESFRTEQAALESGGRRGKRNSVEVTSVQKRKAKSPASTQRPVVKQARKSANPRSQAKSQTLTAPEKKKLIGEKLDSCKRALQGSSKNSRKLAMVDDSKSSTFKTQVTEIQDFLKAAVESDGTGRGDASVNSILYICGSPGVGKTSTVEWCCAQADVNWCCVNVASGDHKAILVDAGEILKMKVKKPTISSFTNFVKKSEEVIVLVIDEIDSLVAARGVESSTKSHGENLLGDLFSLAADPEMPFVLIGISNAVDTVPARRLKFLGMNGKRLTFAPYRQADLVELVVSRIGDTIVDEKALNFVAARVATGSGDARQMMELVSKAVEHKKRSLSELALKAPAPQKPLVTIRDAVQAIKASAPENYSKQIESLPEMAKLVLCVAVSMCKEYPENFSFKKLRSYCSFAAEKEFGDSIDLDTFMSLMQLLVDQGLIMPNRDGDNNLNSQGFGALLEKKVHFGAQLQDVENAVIDMLTEKPIYQRLVDHARENQPK